MTFNPTQDFGRGIVAMTGTWLRGLVDHFTARTTLKGIDGIRTQLDKGGWTVSLINQPDSVFLAKIVSSTSISANRWSYAWQEMYKAHSASTGWTTGTRSGSGDAFNLREIPNSATGTQGNGINVDDLVGTFAIQPAPANTYVFMMPARTAEGLQYWFEHDNAVTGSCSGGT